MIRAATLLALSTLHGGCSPGEPSANPNAADNKEIVAASQGDSRQLGERGSEMGAPISQTRVSITSDRGQVTAELVDNDATRALVRMLPLTIEMRDHLRQEKTGSLPSPLPDSHRQIAFSAGTLGLWGNDDFVIYYRNGRVPPPGIVILGHVRGDLTIFDRPEPFSVRIHQAARGR